MPTLTASALTAASYLQKDLFADSAKKADYVAEVNVANALIENTTAKIQPIIGNSDKKQKVKIYWNKFCGPTAGTAEPDFCTISGSQPDSDSKEYEIDTHVTAKFTLDEALYEDNMLNISEVFADLMLKAKKSCDEKIANVLVSKLDAFTSPNLHEEAPGCPGVVSPQSWATTYIAPHLWTPELMNYFRNVARINKFSAPFLLDGKNLNAQAWLAMMNAANANGAGANKMMNTLKYYEDLVNIEAVAPGKTFMVDRGTVAFASRSRWAGVSAASPIIEADIARKKYSEASENIKGLTYDIYITTECSGPYKKHNVLVHGMYGLYNGAENCNNGTGVLEFVCGACPA
jgi:hypothetical protein